MKYCIIGASIIVFLLSCNFAIAETVSVTLDYHGSDNVIDLGTLLYSNTVEKVLTVKINNCTDEMILSYLFSDVNSSALSIVSRWYSPLQNQTSIILKTNKISPAWYFKNNTRQFIYIDNNSRFLFRVYINYSSILLPENPLDSLTEENIYLTENLSRIWEDYNQTYQKLNLTKHLLISKWNLLNETQFDIEDLNEIITQKTKENNDLNDGILEQVNETNKYKAWYNTKSKDYSSLSSKARGMDDALGKWPIVYIFSVFIVGLFIFLFDRRKTLFRPKPMLVDEAHREHGYTSEAGILDKLKFWKPKHKESSVEFVKSEEDINVKNNVDEQVQPVEIIDDKDYFDEKIDEVNSRIDKLEDKHEKLSTDFKSMHEKIDNILSKKGKKEIA